MTSPARYSRLAAAGIVTLALGACTDLPTSSTPTLDARSLSLGAAPRASHDAVVRADFVAGQVIVRYREGADVDAVAQKHRGRRKKDLLVERTHLVEVEAGDEQSVVAELASDPDVEFAELDYLTVLTPCDVGICLAPNDGFNAGYKWDLHNTGSILNNGTPNVPHPTGKADADIDWVEAFDALGGDAFTGTATIGILDSGIRPTHQEFGGGRIIAARNFATGYAADFIDDRDSHGTHVAGIAAARSDGAGLTGVAFGKNIRLINAKVCERYLFPDNSVRTSCPTSSQAEAIVWATDQGANVLNLSLGGDPRATTGSAAVRTAFQYALSKNTLPVCASGNDNYPDVAFPGRFPECMVVGATDWSDLRAPYSNYGARLEVVAPGGNSNPSGSPSSLILSAGITTNTVYNWKAGTSMATPQVVGLAAMLYATGMTNAAAVRARIIETTDDLGAVGKDNFFGHGRINVYRALTGKEPGAERIAVITPADAAVEGTPIMFDGSASSDPNNHPITFAWSFGDGLFGTGATPTHTFVDNGSFAVALTVRDESGRTTTTTRTQTVVNAAPEVTLAMPASVMSGGTAAIDASFSDLGIADSPWSWTLSWGNGSTSGSTDVMGTIEGARRYCGMGTFPVSLTVVDKDGGSDVAFASIAVSPHTMAVSMPGAFNPKSNGKFPVRIYGSSTLDVRQIDLGSLSVAGADVVVKNNGTFQAAYETGSNGLTDLVVHVPREDMVTAGMPPRSTQQMRVMATLTDGCTLLVGQQALQIN